jgi:hypothetical protein
MMKDALLLSGASWHELTKARKTSATLAPDCLPQRGLVRIQWTGPWTADGMNPKWAWTHTHWIASLPPNGVSSVFDINGGLMLWDTWCEVIKPAITKTIKRADGGFFLTHL